MREIKTTVASITVVTVTCTVIVVVVVERVVGVVVEYDKASGVELMRSEWKELPSE